MGNNEPSPLKGFLTIWQADGWKAPPLALKRRNDKSSLPPIRRPDSRPFNERVSINPHKSEKKSGIRTFIHFTCIFIDNVLA
jgi:hypothetical protein